MRRAALTLAIVLALPGAVWAHGFHVEASWESGQVLVEAYFSDGAPPGGGTVVVRQGERELVSAQLGAEGRFLWVPPAAGDYRFEVTEPGLHTAVAELTVTPSQLEAARTAAASRTAAVSSTTTAAPSPSSAPEPKAHVLSMGEQLLRVAVGLVAIGFLALTLSWTQKKRSATGEVP